MKAIRFHQHGGPEVLKYEDAPDPKILANEVLVKVKACALNHLDVWVRGGVPGWRIPMPHIVGADISGEVAEVGSLVTRVKPGDRVLLCPGRQLRPVRDVLQGPGQRLPPVHGLGRVHRRRIRGVCEVAGDERASHSR